ncbi:MAG: hypothetical protein ACFFG0_53260 [Candidatus Thorarchaeota archaeon]
MPRKDPAKEERKNLYFDLICGIINSGFAVISIIFVSIVYGIRYGAGFYFGLTFCLCYLGVTIFLVLYGIYTKYTEKNYDIISKKKKKRESKPPIVS